MGVYRKVCAKTLRITPDHYGAENRGVLNKDDVRPFLTQYAPGLPGLHRVPQRRLQDSALLSERDVMNRGSQMLRKKGAATVVRHPDNEHDLHSRMLPGMSIHQSKLMQPTNCQFQAGVQVNPGPKPKHIFRLPGKVVRLAVIKTEVGQTRGCLQLVFDEFQ